MNNNFTIESVLKSKCGNLNRSLIETIKKKRKSKFGNNKKEIDGILFDSEREAKRYGELKLLAKAGEIGLIELQVPFELNEGGTHSLKYVADFVYYNARTGENIVEDAKGFRTAIYKKEASVNAKGLWNKKIKET